MTLKSPGNGRVVVDVLVVDVVDVELVVDVDVVLVVVVVDVVVDVVELVVDVVVDVVEDVVLVVVVLVDDVVVVDVVVVDVVTGSPVTRKLCIVPSIWSRNEIPSDLPIGMALGGVPPTLISRKI